MNRQYYLREHLKFAHTRRIQWCRSIFYSCMLFLCIQLSEQLPRPQSEHHPNFAVELGAPLITPLQEDVILEHNSNYTLRCEGKESVKWQIPENPEIIHEEKAFPTQDPSRPFGSMLYLSGVNHKYVGYYYCILESSLPPSAQDEKYIELVNEDKASSIYVFVNDKENLLVPIIFQMIHANQYEDVIIPCKPTMPTVEVLLSTPRDETLSSEHTGRYDPKIGFVVEIRGLTDTGDFICRPKVPSLENEEEDQIIQIQYDGIEHIRPQSDLTTSQQLKSQVETTTKIPHTAPTTVTPTTRVVTTATTTSTTSQNYNRSESTQMSTQSTVTNNNNVYVATNNSKHNNRANATINDVHDKADSNNNNQQYIGNNDRAVDVVLNTAGVGIGFNSLDVGIVQFSDIHNSNHILFQPIILKSHHDYSPSYHVDDDNEIVMHGYSGDGGIGYDNDVLSSETVESMSNELVGMTSSNLSVRINDQSSVFEVTSTPRLRRKFRKRDLDTTTPSYYRSRSSHFGGGSTSRPKTDFIRKPNITSKARGHVFEGESFELICSIEAARDARFSMDWSTPNNIDDRITKGSAVLTQPNTGAHNVGISNITVTNAQKSDSGIYKCTVQDHRKNKAHNSYLMTVLKQNESYVNISEPNNYYSIRENANKTVTITVNYRGYPWPTLTWYKPDGAVIMPSRKYTITTTDTTSTLNIRGAQMVDSGEYLLRGSNEIITEKLQFNVSISDTPIVSLKDVYVQEGDTAALTCKVLSYPEARVGWVFRPCSITPRWPSCDRELEKNFNSSRSARPGETSIETYHDLYFTPKQPGIVTCIAVNKIGNQTAQAHVLIGDITENMAVYGIDESQRIARGDEVTITCAALAYHFSSDIYWYKNGEVVQETEGLKIVSSSTDYSYKKSLKFDSVQNLNQGRYECRARYVNDDDKMENKSISLYVFEPMAPNISHINFDSNSKLERKLGDSMELMCQSDAIPVAELNWYKDNVKLIENDHFTIDKVNSKLIIAYMRPDDDGIFKCIASNRLGTAEASVEVKITDLPGVTVGMIVGLVFLLILLLLLIIYLWIRMSRERKELRTLKAAGLANFEKGAVEFINPALSLDEQADLLPYDRNFEFPRDKLKLGKQLGAGAFGVVLKAYAEGIKPDEKESVVAVKMVKRTADNEVMRALVSELKIMVHLGQHLNVVNLLGAVTKSIAKRELMVIVEFCRFGNLQQFLLRNRKRFIDQVHPETGRIDPTITVQRFSDNFELNREGLKYVNLAFPDHQYMNNMINHINNMNNNYASPNNRRNSDNDPRSGTRAGRPNSRGYVSNDQYDGQMDSCATERTVMTTIPDEETVLSNNSVQPAWRSNYKPDSTEAMTVTTSDLVSWAFQVARGMDYLAMRKVVHGDLAARNLLLCEEGVVKICDFGLARSIYKSDTYKKQGEAPLPIKWLALESLSDHVFNTYTDVWSFGIVMWEFFSLAKVPYPGMDPTQSLFVKLKDGYRMEKPPFANDDLYDIMLECWSTNPESRPLFNVLEKRFGRMLGDEVTSHYMDLNEPYLRSNSEYMKSKPTDYLSLMGSPDEAAPPPPRYVNGHILPEIRIEHSSDDYLQMSPNAGSTTIFSPTRPKDYAISNDTESDADYVHHTDAATAQTTTSFAFPDTLPQQQYSPTLVNNMNSPENKSIRKDGVTIQPEEIPMLHSAHPATGSDGEHSPEQGRKFSSILQQMQKVAPTPSPRHHIAETQLSNRNEEVENDDSYVNVRSPQKKPLNNNGERKVDAFSNPSYQMLKTAGDQHGK